MNRVVAQFGSALDWGSRGRRFKSCQPDQLMRAGQKVKLLACFFVSFLFIIVVSLFSPGRFPLGFVYARNNL